ncbi:hypothetical protein BK025_01020 [Sodalis sp. TME1]|nr:hypothetical protein BK025_01020 [Sodalis sp. TME1]
MHHVWLIEDLSGGRVRNLTQETQNGKPALELSRTRPNPMLNGHQTWLDGLVAAARRASRASPRRPSAREAYVTDGAIESLADGR